MEPTFFSLVPFPNLSSISPPSLSQPALVCMAAAICGFGAGYVIERIAHQGTS
jgi:hypothetical protein